MEKSILTWLDRAEDLYQDKVAYRDGENTISFRDAAGISRAVGSCLTEYVQPQEAVAVLTGRSVMTPPCFFGVVRAGCFYAPMDATMPDTRLNQILSVIKAEVMIVDRENLEKANGLSFSGKMLILEEIIDTPVNEEALKKAVFNLTGKAPLYAIFTSGSTGVPKGVITSHESLMCYIDGLQEVISLNESDVLGNQSPLDYIAAIRDIYLPILTGAETVILPKNEFAQPKLLFETMNRYGVTVICWSTAGIELPARLDGFLESKPEHLRCVVFSGSVISSVCLKEWQENLPDTVFINQYGPTEATGSCTYYTIRDKVTEDTVLPIGVPYKHYQILLLNEENQTPEIGETGEICVAGPALALGYYGAPEITAKNFIQNPLNPNYPETIYRTGDLGKYDEDGILWFLGRMDRQIKHMGHRIELDEIEMTAQKIDGIKECCALYQKKKSLLYLFYSGEATAKEISLYFRANMPAFMVPRKVINMDELPHLPNGKLDRKSLETQFK